VFLDKFGNPKQKASFQLYGIDGNATKKENKQEKGNARSKQADIKTCV
jgi:hypothetical protein